MRQRPRALKLARGAVGSLSVAGFVGVFSSLGPLAAEPIAETAVEEQPIAPPPADQLTPAPALARELRTPAQQQAPGPETSAPTGRSPEDFSRLATVLAMRLPTPTTTTTTSTTTTTPAPLTSTRPTAPPTSIATTTTSPPATDTTAALATTVAPSTAAPTTTSPTTTVASPTTVAPTTTATTVPTTTTVVSSTTTTATTLPPLTGGS